MDTDLIRNELLRRLRIADPQDFTREMAIALGIDPDASPIEPPELEPMRDTLPPLPNESALYRGHVPFEMTVSMLGETITLDCRVSFAGTLYDDENIETGGPLRTLGSCVSRCEVLDWGHEHRRDMYTQDRERLGVPKWVQVDLLALFPTGAEKRLDELVDEELFALERKSTA